MSESIAVIGGSGFIGSRLVQQLLDHGYQVRIVDKRDSERFPRLAVRCDVRDRVALADACRGADAIYNLAAEHRDDVRPLSLYRDVNVGGAENTAAVAEEVGCNRIVFTSSVAVYGFSGGPADEDTAFRPFNEYGRTKLAAERVFLEWQEANAGSSLSIVRPTVVFGEGNRGNVYTLIRQIAEGPFFMLGNGTNRKSIAYVENVAAFLRFALSFGAGVHVYNYVDQPDHDMNELVAKIRRALGRRERGGLRIPYAVGYALGLVADGLAAAIRRPLPVSRVRVKKFTESTLYSADKMLGLGFRPPVSLDAGLRRTIAFEYGNRPQRDPIAGECRDAVP